MSRQVFFVSDFHLGIPNRAASLEREKKIIRWLHHFGPQMQALWLLGDVFDFWIDYKYVVPRGYVRLLGALAELSDSGLPVHFIPGNHDQWLRDYFSSELGWQIHPGPLRISLGAKTFFLGHGDGLGPGDHGYKLIKWLFSRKLNRWLFRQIHPDLGARIAQFFSYSSRHYSFFGDDADVNPDNERLYRFCRDYQKSHPPADYFIFGHRHKPLWLPLPEGGVYVNLGDWLTYCTFARFDGTQLYLEKFES